ncbi:MAG: mandelate racemase/muconate lactonizing protein [Pedosphaera sp.]|nr:mandelate racemase/muconate lactonizing protein [Pedosphaera sp.]
MKITRIETIPVRVPLKAEFAIRAGRGGSHIVSPFLLVKVHTDEGIVGIGEASCTPRWSGEDQVTGAHLIHTYLEPLLVGEDPTMVEELTKKFRLAFAENYFTKAAVEMALWDIAGKAAGKPVYELFGGKVREFVPTKWSVSGLEPEKAAGIAKWAVAQGFKAMKVKVGIEPDGDVERVQAVRQAVGAGIKLGVDANGGWTPEAAVNTIERLCAFGICFAEQPVPPEDIALMAGVRKKSRVPLIADESIYTLQDAKTLAVLGAADVISIYVGKAGGLGPARKIAGFAESVGLKCTLGSNLELGVGSAAMVHLALASRGITAEEFPCDIIGPLFYEDDIVREPLPIKPGEARANDKPGLGVELDEEKVERYRVK